MNKLKLDDQELANNPSTRIPACVLLDTSSSMQGDPIDELNLGYKMFIKELLEDELTKYSVDLSVITFGRTVKKVAPFTCWTPSQSLLSFTCRDSSKSNVCFELVPQIGQVIVTI